MTFTSFCKQKLSRHRKTIINLQISFGKRTLPSRRMVDIRCCLSRHPTNLLLKGNCVEACFSSQCCLISTCSWQKRSVMKIFRRPATPINIINYQRYKLQYPRVSTVSAINTIQVPVTDNPCTADNVLPVILLMTSLVFTVRMFSDVFSEHSRIL